MLYGHFTADHSQNIISNPIFYDWYNLSVMDMDTCYLLFSATAHIRMRFNAVGEPKGRGLLIILCTFLHFHTPQGLLCIARCFDWIKRSSISNSLHKAHQKPSCWAPCWGFSLCREPSQNCKILDWNWKFWPLVPCCHSPTFTFTQTLYPSIRRINICQWEAPSLLKTMLTTCRLIESFDVWASVCASTHKFEIHHSIITYLYLYSILSL